MAEVALGAAPSTPDGLLSHSRDERESQHCAELAQSLHDAYVMKDVYLKCSDDICVPVHKFVLGSQSECASTGTVHMPHMRCTEQSGAAGYHAHQLQHRATR